MSHKSFVAFFSCFGLSVCSRRRRLGRRLRPGLRAVGGDSDGSFFVETAPPKCAILNGSDVALKVEERECGLSRIKVRIF